MSNDLCKLSAVEAVALLKKGELTPLDLIDAAAERIAMVEPRSTRCPRSASSAPATCQAIMAGARLATRPARRDGSPACRSRSRI